MFQTWEHGRTHPRIQLLARGASVPRLDFDAFRFRQQIESIHVNLNTGPCGKCADYLNAIYSSLLPPDAQARATISWSKAHRGKFPTTAADRSKLLWGGPKGPVVDEDDVQGQVQ